MTHLFRRLNLDIICLLTSFLEFEDVVHLALSSQTLADWIYEGVISRSLVESSVCYTREAALAREEGIGYGEAAERVCKRRRAIALARPYLSKTVAFGREFAYTGGILSYLSKDGDLRILDILESSHAELVIDLSPFLEELFSATVSRLRIHSFAGNVAIVTCQTSPKDDHRVEIARRILALKICCTPYKRSLKVIFHEILETTHKLFVRQAPSCIVYGVSRQHLTLTRRQWHIRSLCLTEDGEEMARPPQIFTADSFGSDINFNIAFHIHGGYFHIVSTLPSPDFADKEWVSMYDCHRFSMQMPKINTRTGYIEAESQRIYRRRHTEGPIHDSWTDLSLQSDERTGELMIVESRREWVKSSSTQQRNCYIHPLKFESRPAELGPDPDQPPTEHALVRRRSDHYVQAVPEPTRPPLELHSSSTIHRDSTSSEFKLTKTKFWSYSLSAKSFIDVAELHPLLNQPSGKHELVLRTSAAEKSPSNGSGPNIFQSRRVAVWPPDGSSARARQVINPPAAAGEEFVGFTMDERAMVFMRGKEKSRCKAIVLLCFDPGVKLGTECKEGEPMDVDEGQLDTFSGMEDAGAKYVRRERAMHLSIS